MLNNTMTSVKNVKKVMNDVSDCMKSGSVGLLLGFIIAFFGIWMFVQFSSNSTRSKVTRTLGLEGFALRGMGRPGDKEERFGRGRPADKEERFGNRGRGSVCDDNPDLCKFR